MRYADGFGPLDLKLQAAGLKLQARSSSNNNMRNFKKLLIWQAGMRIVNKVYDLVPFFPEEERFGMRVQMTKCAVLIPSNIAEGSAKRSQKDYLRFVEISLASSYELETQTLIVRDRKWLPEESVNELIQMVEMEQRMISKFIDKL